MAKTIIKVGVGPGTLAVVPKPAPWPNANARLLGVGAGLPVSSLDRLAAFSPNDFERFILEWADDYLPKLPIGVDEVQQRGGAGDKGRDIVVWLDPSSVKPRRWHLYQCKHYAGRRGAGVAAAEIAKVLYYTERGEYTRPDEYWFVTHKGVTGDFQDLIDDPAKLKAFILANWSKYCAKKIAKNPVVLSPELKAHINTFDFSIFKAKQPQQLINEHAQTRYHLAAIMQRFDRFAAPSTEFA